MAEARVGAYLRERRERRGLSIDDVATATRIASRLIHALEEDRTEALPAAVYVRGFIRAYCECIGASAAEALVLYDKTLDRARPEPPPITVRIESSTTRSGRPRGPRWMVAVALLGLLGMGLYGLAPVLAPPRPASRASTPARPPGAAWSLEPASAPVSPPAAPAPGGGAPSDRSLVLRADEPTWVRVTPEDARPSEEVLQPGSVREWRSASRFRLTVGNAGGVRVELDGETLPALGRRGEVVRDLVLPREPSP